MSANRNVRTQAHGPLEDKSLRPSEDKTAPAEPVEDKPTVGVGEPIDGIFVPPTPGEDVADKPVPDGHVAVVLLQHITIGDAAYGPGQTAHVDAREAAVLVGEYRARYRD